MKNTIFLKLMLLTAVAAAAVSCKDYRSEYLEEYQTMVYFRNGGEQEIALYSTGEDGFYSIPVCKGGRDQSGTITAEVSAFDENATALYNAVNMTSYSLIPPTMYSFVDNAGNDITANPLELKFGEKEAVKVLKLKLKTEAMKAHMAANPGKKFILGFQLFSKDKVSDNMNLILISPKITIPYLKLSTVGVESYAYDMKNDSVHTDYPNRVKLSIDENRWDFTCQLEVKDAAWIDAYNAAHGTGYELLPAKFYEIPASVDFVKGENEVSFNVSVVSKVGEDFMPSLHEYVIPVAVKASTKTEFVPFVSAEADEYVYMLQVLMNNDTPIALDVTQITAFYDGLTGYQKDKLVDGDESTFWSSPGSKTYGGFGGDAEWGFWFDIALDKPLSVAAVSYIPNAKKPERSPTRIKLGVSDDGVNYTLLKDVATEDMHYLTTWHSLPLIKRDTPFSYIRIGLLETFLNDVIYPINIDDVNMTCEVAEIKLFGSEN